MRETGFYWVLPKHDDEWQIATWRADEGKWYVTGLGKELNSDVFREIDERKIERDV